MKLAGWALGVGLVGLGLVLLGVATVWGTGWGKDLFAPGATLVAVSLTVWGASRGVVRWSEQRRRDRDAAEFKRREEVYTEIATFMVGRFKSGFSSIDERRADEARDRELRARAAIWAGRPTLERLGSWQTLISKKSQGDLTDKEQDEFKNALGDAIVEMRNDLSPGLARNNADRDTILKSIFNE